MRYRSTSFLSAALLVVLPLASLNAFGQSGGQLAPNRVATNLTGATTAIAPPDGFNPLEASDEDLAAYGFPPRPDASAAPQGFATWKKAMLASKTRVFPQLEQTNRFAGPKRTAVSSAAVPSEGNAGIGYSDNWSGPVDFSGAKSYNSTSTFYYIIGDYVVPVAEQAFGACTGSWDYEVSWVGIDGDGSNDVLQAGTQSDAYCGDGGVVKATYYTFWYEWFPYGWVNVNNFPVTAGDDVFVEVWHTSATRGYAYMVNYQTNQAVEIGFTAPSGVKLVGNSAEWIVERPTVGTLANLTNYISEYFSDAYAYTENGKQFTPGTSGASLVDMLDNSGYVISYPTLLGSTGIWFQDENSARFASEP